MELSARSPNVKVLRLDVTDESSLEAAAAAVRDASGKLDLCLNVAAVLHIPGTSMQPEVAYERVRMDNLMLSYQTNAMGPMMVARHMVPLLKGGGDRAAGRPAVLASLSARVSSIGDNQLGGWYAYRASKSALNALMKTLSVELARKKMNVSTVLLHPGTCDTDMSLPFRKNVAPEKLFSRDRAVSQLLGIIDGVSMSDNGTFKAWDGQEIPW